MRLNLRFACFSSIIAYIPKNSSLLLAVFTQYSNVWYIILQVDLTEYVEKHEFVFDAVLDEDVSNDEVGTNCITFFTSVFKYCKSVPRHCLPSIYRFIVKQWNLWFQQYLIEQKQLVLLMDKRVYV
jgi:hypothetical protein